MRLTFEELEVLRYPDLLTDGEVIRWLQEAGYMNYEFRPTKLGKEVIEQMVFDAYDEINTLEASKDHVQ